MTNGDPNPAPAAIPWYRSPVYIGAVVTVVSSLASVAPKAATELGLTSSDAISHLVDTVFGVVTVASGAYTAYKRSKSPVQPITMTQARADNHNGKT